MFILFFLLHFILSQLRGVLSFYMCIYAILSANLSCLKAKGEAFHYKEEQMQARQKIEKHSQPYLFYFYA